MATQQAPVPTGHDEHPAHEEHAHATNYVRVYVILMILLAVSVAGPELGIRWVTLITAFGVAVWKAYLVAKHFMHLNIAPRYIGYVVATCLVFMVLLFAGVSPDVMKQEGQGWTKPEDWQPAQQTRVSGPAHGDAGH